MTLHTILRPLALTLPLMVLVGCGPSRLSDSDVTRLCELQVRCGGSTSQSSCETLVRAARDQASARSCSGAFGSAGRCVVRVNACSSTECDDESRRLDECLGRSSGTDAGVRVDARISTGTDARIPMTGTEGAVRQLNGYLEVFHMGEWRGVCDDSFSVEEANVVCTQLGMSTTNANASTVTGPDSDFWLDDVACTGSEPNISSCEHAEWGVHNCGAGEHLLVSCL